MSIDLVIDTSTDALICALISHSGTDSRSPETAQVLQEKTIPTSRDHMELLIPLLQEIMQAAHISHSELDSIIVGVGPGPFTGLRVGIASAIALAQTWNIPLFSAISLEALALGAIVKVEEKQKEVLALSDARRKEWYAARYRVQHDSLVCLQRPYAASPSQIDFSQAHIICPEKIANQLVEYTPIIQDHPFCLDLWMVARGDGSWEGIHPLYCRQPDAIPGQAPKKVIP